MNKKQNDSRLSYKIRKIDPVNPESDIISEGARIIRHGGVVAFPTLNLYGIGADALNPDAVDRVFETKERPLHKPILVLIKDRNQVEMFARSVPPAGERIMDRLWPGGITLVFEAKKTLPVNLTAGSGKIGVRLTRHPVALALIKDSGTPITGTSANLSGEAGCSKIIDLSPSVANKLDLIIDSGQLEKGSGSTVVDVTVFPPVILRQGSVLEKEIFSVF